MFSYQFSEGIPDEDEIFPFRIYPKYISNISPTFKKVNNLFSVTYYIRLAIEDSDGNKIITLLNDNPEIYLYREEWLWII